MREHVVGYLRHLCGNVDKLIMLFVAEAVALLLHVPSYFIVEPGSETEVVIYLNVFGLIGLMSVTGTLIFACYRI